MRLDKEISHSSHPGHKLKVEHTEVPFRCDGCKEAGIGYKYRCDLCDFDLHKVCALATDAISHHFYPRCDFRFHSRPPGRAARVCDACRKDVTGFVYHCGLCDFDLHPCCANLPPRLDDGERNLYLHHKLPDSCHRCGRKGTGWCYRSECRSYCLHVSCVKELLLESWQATYLGVDKNKARVMQTRVPCSLGGAALQSHHRGGRRTPPGKVGRGFQIAGAAARVIISAVLGDPTPIIAAVVGGLLSK